MTKQKVRGLLDAVGLSDDEYRLQTVSPDFVPGLGLGTTPEARRWAYLGYQAEIDRAFRLIEKTEGRKAGRPKTEKPFRLPSRRAVHMWLELRNMPYDYRKKSNRDLIKWIKSRTDLSTHLAVLWPKNMSKETSLERSLSEGRAYWGIKDDWTSEILEAGLEEALKNEENQ